MGRADTLPGIEFEAAQREVDAPCADLRLPVYSDLLRLVQIVPKFANIYVNLPGGEDLELSASYLPASFI